MIDREIVFIVYVSDIEASVSFYTSILNLEVSFSAGSLASVVDRSKQYSS